MKKLPMTHYKVGKNRPRIDFLTSTKKEKFISEKEYLENFFSEQEPSKYVTIIKSRRVGYLNSISATINKVKNHLGKFLKCNS